MIPVINLYTLGFLLHGHQIMFKNYNNPEKAITDLIENTPDKYFKFSHFNNKDKIIENKLDDSSSNDTESSN